MMTVVPYHKPEVRYGLQDIVAHFRSQGIVAQEDVCILTALGLVHRMQFGIEGRSGTGKTAIASAALLLLPEWHVYRMELSSDKAEAYNAAAINSCSVIYVPELQKAVGSGHTTVEIIKTLSEGRPSIRRVKTSNGTIEHKINAGKGILYTLAHENAYKSDMELFRRMPQLYTSADAFLTASVIAARAEAAAGTDTSRKADTAAISAQMVQAMLLPFRFVNPFAPALQHYLPDDHVLMRSYAGHYFRFMEASARFHHGERVIQKVPDARVLYLSLQDARSIHDLYMPHLTQSLRRVGWTGSLRDVDWEQVRKSGVQRMEHDTSAALWRECEESCHA